MRRAVVWLCGYSVVRLYVFFGKNFAVKKIEARLEKPLRFKIIMIEKRKERRAAPLIIFLEYYL